ncbi:hypothetical protein Tco_0777306 [Tanacetum coccineum]
MLQKRVTEVIAEYERNRTNLENAGGSGPANARGVVAPDVQGCSYKTFLNCKPHTFNGTEGVVGLKCWFEKLEQVFEISKCAKEDKVKFDACTFEGHALTWWNGDDIEGYNNRFHDLALLCPDLVTPEMKKIERYIRGLPERVKANVTSSKPASFHDAINMARELIEQAIQAKAMRIGESNKRKWEEHQRNNNNNRNNNTYHQQQNMRYKAAKAYVAAPAGGKVYLGNLPLCNRYKATSQTSALLVVRKANG